MELWYPEARRSLLRVGSGSYIGKAPWRGVLHRTEGDTLAGALATYHKTGNYPHFTIDENTVEQHTALNVATTTLKHPKNSIDTNRLYCAQIEIVGWTKDSASMSDKLCTQLSRLMRWIEAQTGIRPGYLDLNRRFWAEEWKIFNGWCGHVHVPFNDHTDPGNIPIGKLFSPITPKPQVVITNKGFLDVNLKSFKFENVFLPEGHGWVGVNIDEDRIVNVIQHGSFEPVDGSWTICKFAKQARALDANTKSVIEITGGDNKQTITFEVWYVE